MLLLLSSISFLIFFILDDAFAVAGVFAGLVFVVGAAAGVFAGLVFVAGAAVLPVLVLLPSFYIILFNSAFVISETFLVDIFYYVVILLILSNCFI